MKNKFVNTILLSMLITFSMVLPLVPSVFSNNVLLDPLEIPKYVNQLGSAPPVYIPEIVRDKATNTMVLRYTVYMNRFTQQILPTEFPDGTPTGFSETNVWGYGGFVRDTLTGRSLGFVESSPGPTFEAIRGVPIEVTWVNNITGDHMFAVDPTLHWANPNEIPMTDVMEQVAEGVFPPFPPGFNGTDYLGLNPEEWNAQDPVPLIPHLHGGEVQSTSDGHPEAWFTNSGEHGEAYNSYRPTDANSTVFYYPNEQPPTTLWYHDHALGITRINVMSGLAGFYLLRDVNDKLAPVLPKRQFEMPIVIQDRTFLGNGEFYFYGEGNVPELHPYWNPGFFGNTIMVNGLVWPNMDVTRGQYRFRLLDGSNARFYTLSFRTYDGEFDAYGNPIELDGSGYPVGGNLTFTQIGSDGGYLYEPVELTELTIAPGERADILVDFSDLEPGTTVILINTALAPFKGPFVTDPDPELIPDPATVGQIMRFTVTNKGGPKVVKLPPMLNPTLSTFPTLSEADYYNTVVLTEVMEEDEPVEILLNGQKWAGALTSGETPELDSTWDWIIVNPTEDTHPIHFHLVQFQLIYRQNLTDAEQYLEDWIDSNNQTLRDVYSIDDWSGLPYPEWYTPETLNVADYLSGPSIDVTNYLTDQGWKDTIQAHPGQITVIRIRYKPIDESYNGVNGPGNYPFNAWEGPGYVWHCHILDHEDNEMMRPYTVMEPTVS